VKPLIYYVYALLNLKINKLFNDDKKFQAHDVLVFNGFIFLKTETGFGLSYEVERIILKGI